jgi:phosphopantothenate---cysteine ligase (ATP)
LALFVRQLETDPELLIPKAHAALERYGHQIVIGNMLHNRKYEVVFVSVASPRKQGSRIEGAETILASSSPTVIDPLVADGVRHTEEWIRLPGHHHTEGSAEPKIPSPLSTEDPSGLGPTSRSVSEIEELIVERLIEMHDGWVHRGNGSR